MLDDGWDHLCHGLSHVVGDGFMTVPIVRHSAKIRGSRRVQSTLTSAQVLMNTFGFQCETCQDDPSRLTSGPEPRQ